MIVGMGQYTHKDYAALQDKAVADGVTRPSYEQRVKENAWMRNMDSKDGAWTGRGAFWNFRNDSGAEDYGLYNWKDPATFKLIKTGTLTYTSMDGMKGDGTTGYYNTSYTPFNSSVWGLGNCSIAYDLLTNASGIHIGSNAVAVNYNTINGLTQVTRLNQDSSANVVPANPGVGRWIMNKTTSLLNDFYKNGSLDASRVVPEEAVKSNRAFAIFCRNNTGTFELFSAVKIGYVTFGAGILNPASFDASLVNFKL